MLSNAKKIKCTTDSTNYKPADVPNALKLIHRDMAHAEKIKERLTMEAQIVVWEAFNVFAIKAAGRMENFELPKDVRRAWGDLQRVLAQSGAIDQWTERNIGYVFYPQLQTAELIELWVGVKTDSTSNIPEGVELLQIPARRYAAVPSVGDREQMNKAYQYIYQWVEKEGLQIDAREDVFTVEPNRLIPVNPFEIPADEIDRFDFQIMLALKD